MMAMKLPRFFFDPALRAQEKGEPLHCKRAGACARSGPDVDISRFQDAQVVHPRMLKKSFVLRGQNGIYKIFREIAERIKRLFSRSGEQVGDQRRLHIIFSPGKLILSETCC